MKNKRIRAANKKGGDRGGSSWTDFISKMPDDLLLFIMWFLPIKDAVVTGCLSTRWRSLWLNLLTLNFDGSKSLAHIAKNRHLLGPERMQFIKQVNGVLHCYNQPMIQDFRIRFDFDKSSKHDIDAWLQSAVNMGVENLELDFTDCNQRLHSTYVCYDFPNRLSYRPIGHMIYKWPTSKFAFIEIPNLRKLLLKSVNMSRRTLEQILVNSQHLETLSLHGEGSLRYIHASGQKLELKHIEIVHCPAVNLICLNNFNLVSFTYKGGPEIALLLSNLPNLKVVDIDEGVTSLERNVFTQLASCLSYLQVLSMDIHAPKQSLKIATVPELPMVKKLKLSFGAQKDDCLLQFTSIAEACPSLEVFTIELNWLSPARRRKKVRHAAAHPHQHLKRLEFVGYYGRVSDLELALYIINNAAKLDKIFIDPRGLTRRGITTVQASLKAVEVARSLAKRQLEKLMLQTRGVELVII